MKCVFRIACVVYLAAGGYPAAFGTESCAHRGDVKHAPENTLPAFTEAVARGAAMIELDVHRTSDGHLVLMHDNTVDRTTNGTGTVSEMTFEALRGLDAGSWYGPEFEGLRVPTLEEALKVIPKEVRCNVHLKRGEKLAAQCAVLVRDMGRLEQCFLACSEDQVVEARGKVPEIQVCNMTRQGSDRKAYIDLTIAWRCQYIQLHQNQGVEGLAEDVQRLHENGVLVNFFGAQEEGLIRTLAAAGVDYILTDDLGLCQRVLHPGTPLTEEGAKKVAEVLRGSFVARWYAGNMEATRLIPADWVEALATLDGSAWEVRVNGRGVDPAALYVKSFRPPVEWGNVALAAGLEAGGNPAVLDPWTPGEVLDFSPTLFAPVDDKGAKDLLMLERHGEALGGYWRADDGTKTDLAGTMTALGEFVFRSRDVKEAEWGMTGRMAAEVDRLRGREFGGDLKEREFRRIGAEAVQRLDVDLWGRKLTGELRFPVFDAGVLPWHRALNRAVSRAALEMAAAFEEDQTEIWSEGRLYGPMTFRIEAEFEFDILDYEIGLVGPECASVLLRGYQFTGGAHGSHLFQTVNLTWDEGETKAIDLERLGFGGEESLGALSSLLLAQLREQGASWVVQGQVTALKAEELAIFLVCPEGIRFFFPPYAMGPYAEGTYVVDVAAEDVAPFASEFCRGLWPGAGVGGGAGE